MAADLIAFFEELIAKLSELLDMLKSFLGGDATEGETAETEVAA